MITQRPNILLITTHDTGRHFGCYGVPTVSTPAIDALAADGVRFTQFFSVSPICSPSRASLVTGRYPQSHGEMGIASPPWNFRLNAGERPLGRILRQVGYHTALFGLQHETLDPTQLGFVEMQPRQPCAPANVVAHEVAQFLTKPPQPFFAQVGFFETHTPYDFGGVQPNRNHGVHVPPYLLDNEAARRHLAHLQGAVRKADDAIDVIQEALRQNRLEHNTLLIFTVDHGIEVPRAKWFLYDPGLAVAFLCRYPEGGVCGGRISDWLLSNVDVVPSLLELLDLPIPDNIEGVSFAPLWRAAACPHRARRFSASSTATKCAASARTATS